MSPGHLMMCAAQYDRFGGPEVLSVATVPRPSPGPRQGLVRVHASSVNPVEARIRSGAMRLMTGRRFPRRTGFDFAGEAGELGSKVTDVTVGEHVWGMLSDVSGRTGAAGDCILATPKAVNTAPSGTDLVTAAVLPSVGVTALRALRDAPHLRSGQRLLVVGASGGIRWVAAAAAIRHPQGPRPADRSDRGVKTVANRLPYPCPSDSPHTQGG